MKRLIQWLQLVNQPLLHLEFLIDENNQPTRSFLWEKHHILEGHHFWTFSDHKTVGKRNGIICETTWQDIINPFAQRQKGPNASLCTPGSPIIPSPCFPYDCWWISPEKCWWSAWLSSPGSSGPCRTTSQTTGLGTHQAATLISHNQLHTKFPAVWQPNHPTD